MSPEATARHSVAPAILGVIVVLLLVAFLGRPWTDPRSKCRSDSDCSADRQCMAHTFDHHSWLRILFAYKTCEITCGPNGECPSGYECVIVDHGPGPGPFCGRRPNWPWYSQPDAGSPALPGP